VPGLLASVATPEEAALALALGADILDLKRPAAGALGAWPVAELRAAVARFGGGIPLSATIAEAVAETGVGYVKVGIFAGGGGGGDPRACVAALAPLAARARLVAVLMADQRPDLGLLPRLAAAGFAGAMLDTAGKRDGGLRRHLPDGELARFVAAARAEGLLCGLAGSLGLGDVAPLAALGPDYLGFRGALCGGGRREDALDPESFRSVREAVSRASSATATAGAQRSTASAAAV
jgi:(5-formylfuran-3-yl)methyl phosphate synthase